MIVEAPRQPLPAVGGPDPDQMHIGGRLRLREEAREVSHQAGLAQRQ
jgi:hypothetical protein